MATLTRQQLIDVIDQYIYANGQQRITADQLHEILLEIANAFEMVGGGGGASDLEAVLEEGSEVTDGREITNSFGGKIQLAVAPLTTLAEAPAPAPIYKYLGINVTQSPYIGQVYSDKSKTVIGNIQTTDLTKTLFNVVPTADEVYAGTIYNVLPREVEIGGGKAGGKDASPEPAPGPGPRGSGSIDFLRGVTSIYIDEDSNAMHLVSEKGVGSYVKDNNSNASSNIRQTGSSIETLINVDGSITTHLLAGTEITNTIQDTDTNTSNKITAASSITKIEAGDLAVSHAVTTDGVLTETNDGSGTFVQNVQGISNMSLDVTDPSNNLHISHTPSETYTAVTNASTEAYSRTTNTPTRLRSQLFNEDGTQVSELSMSMEPYLTNMTLFDPETETTDTLFLDPQENLGGTTLTSYNASNQYASVNVRPTIATITGASGGSSHVGSVTVYSEGVYTSVVIPGASSLINQSGNTIEMTVGDTITLNADTIVLNGALNFMKSGAETIAIDGTENAFVIPHGLGVIPGSLALTFSDGSNPEFRSSVRSVDTTHINIVCPSPPAAGSITVYWQVFR